MASCELRSLGYFRELRSVGHFCELRSLGPFRARRSARYLRVDNSGAAMLPTARKLAFHDVPVIDLGPVWSGDAAKRRAVADEIAEVCGRIGFMYIKNHGVAKSDIDGIFKTAEDFHGMSAETKMLSAMARHPDAQGQGYLPGMTKGTGKNLSENLQEAFQFRRPLADHDARLL